MQHWPHKMSFLSRSAADPTVAVRFISAPRSINFCTPEVCWNAGVKYEYPPLLLRMLAIFDKLMLLWPA